MDLVIRPAEPADVDVLHRFVVALAAAEEHPDRVTAQPWDLAAALFGPRPLIAAVLALAGGHPVGCALHRPTYSTISGRPGVHLEDLYVEPEHRGDGVGRLLLAHVAGLAADLGGNLDWWVLRANTSAIGFYDRIGARTMDELHVMRLGGPALTTFLSTTPC